MRRDIKAEVPTSSKWRLMIFHLSGDVTYAHDFRLFVKCIVFDHQHICIHSKRNSLYTFNSSLDDPERPELRPYILLSHRPPHFYEYIEIMVH